MERNITLDYFKAILCILVITIHIQPLLSSSNDNLLGWYISNGIARIAVPSFFIINGYYIYNKISDFNYLKNYLKKLFIVYITWTLIYNSFFHYQGKKDLLITLFTGYYHLWYLAAVLVGSLILFYLKQVVKNNNILLLLSVFLIILGYIIQNEVNDISKVYLYRNVIFIGFPFIFLGYFIKHLEKRLHLIDNKYLYGILIISLILLLVESTFSNLANSTKDIYVSLIVLCPFLFIFILKYSKHRLDDGYIGQLTSCIYFSHIIIISLSQNILNWNNGNYIYIYFLILYFFL